MGAKRSRNWRRTVNRYVGLVATVVGMAVVLSSLLFLDNLVIWYTTIMVGLAIVLAGFLYGAHPFLTNERQFLALREEVDHFMSLVRELNKVATRSGRSEELDQLKGQMMASVERMADRADLRRED